MRIDSVSSVITFVLDRWKKTVIKNVTDERNQQHYVITEVYYYSANSKSLKIESPQQVGNQIDLRV